MKRLRLHHPLWVHVPMALLVVGTVAALNLVPIVFPDGSVRIWGVVGPPLEVGSQFWDLWPDDLPQRFVEDLSVFVALQLLFVIPSLIVVGGISRSGPSSNTLHRLGGTLVPLG